MPTDSNGELGSKRFSELYDYLVKVFRLLSNNEILHSSGILCTIWLQISSARCLKVIVTKNKSILERYIFKYENAHIGIHGKLNLKN